MLYQAFFRSTLLSLIVFSVSALAQSTPEMSVNGIKLGDRTSARSFLTTYLPTTDDQGRASYFFYNDLANQIWKLTAASFDDPFMIVELEVFTVGASYQKPHNQLQKVGSFVTESKIFVGKKGSVASAILGDALASDTRVGPKSLVKKKGEPTRRAAEGERNVMIYEVPNIEIADEKGEKSRYDYTGRYEFRDNRLKRFVLSIRPVAAK